VIAVIAMILFSKKGAYTMNNTKKYVGASVALAAVLFTSIHMSAMQKPKQLPTKTPTEVRAVILDNITNLLESHTQEIKYLANSVQELRKRLDDLATKTTNPEIFNYISTMLARHNAAIKEIANTLSSKK
jgi:hypothetical protein